MLQLFTIAFFKQILFLLIIIFFAFLVSQKKNFLSEEKFQDVSKKMFGNSPNYGPHYYFEIGSVDIFEKNLKEVQTEFDENNKMKRFQIYQMYLNFFYQT